MKMVESTTWRSVLLTLAVTSLSVARGEVESSWAVVGEDANIPCNIRPPQPDDEIYLVLWFKDTNPQPIYSLDSRGDRDHHWTTDTQFGSRAVYRNTLHPSQLIIKTVLLSDGGLYTCRVDFRNSPTTIQKTELIVVEKATKPVILDDEGVQVMGMVGPYRLGQPLILVCVGEGNPPPTLLWTRDGQPLDKDMDPGTGEEIVANGSDLQQRNTLVITSLDREHAGNTLACQAVNNNRTLPTQTKVNILIHMPVTSVRISNGPSAFREGNDYDLLCEAAGSEPSPTITWHMLDTEGRNHSLTGSKEQQNESGNVTMSTISITVDRRMDGNILQCTASNQMFLPVSAQLQIAVNYPPYLEAVLPGHLKSGQVVEGAEVQIDCKFRSSPPPNRFYWKQDNTVISEQQTLIIKRARSIDSGVYRCFAENSEGLAESEGKRISVLYKPQCKHAAVHEHDIESELDTPGVDLRCEVDSLPAATSFRWLFNSSHGSFEIPSAKPLMSFMNYAKSQDGEQGEVLCWATNPVGIQGEPCVFHIVPLGSPHPPANCQITQRTIGSVEVACEEGFSGGLEQHFVLEVFQMVNGTQQPVASNWSREAKVSVSGLQANTSYILAMHSANQKGQSPTVYVGGQTAPWQPMYPKSPGDRMPILYIIVAVLCSIMLLSLILSLTAACRRHLIMKRNKNIQPPALLEPGFNLNREEGSDQTAPLMNAEFRKSLERRVSFRPCSCSHQVLGAARDKWVSHGTLNGSRKDSRSQAGLVEKAVVRSYSIDKLRPRCPVCNPEGSLPYPYRENGSVGRHPNGRTVQAPLPPAPPQPPLPGEKYPPPRQDGDNAQPLPRPSNGRMETLSCGSLLRSQTSGSPATTGADATKMQDASVARGPRPVVSVAGNPHRSGSQSLNFSEVGQKPRGSAGNVATSGAVDQTSSPVVQDEKTPFLAADLNSGSQASLKNNNLTNLDNPKTYLGGTYTYLAGMDVFKDSGPGQPVKGVAACRETQNLGGRPRVGESA